MSDNTFDVVVIGGGPGGYVAAIRAAQLGMKTALVEREHLGGICLNWGCIPTKALLRSADIFRTMQHASAYGLSAPGASFDLAAIVKRSRGVSAQLSAGVKGLLKKNKVTVFDGVGKLAGKGKVAVAGKNNVTLSGKHIILATGGRARIIPGLEPDGKFVWTYKEALVPDTVPKALLVIGSGAIGIEFASFFNALGAQVTVVEMMDRVMPVEDEEISALARKQFEKQGMRIITNATVKGLKKSANNVSVQVDVGGKVEDIVVDRVISAVGIVANVEDIGLEGTKIKVDRGHVVTNKWCETDEPGVYAIGDLTAPPWLAHKASHEGVICVEKIAGIKDVHPLENSKIPGCTYCHPQVASVGLSEKKAIEKGYQVKVGRFPFIGNGKAIALGEPEGLIKTVFDAKTGELLGAHMIGAEVTEMIQGYTIAKTLETTEAELMHTVFPHPTLSEMMHEAVLSAYGRAIHF
ncbi:Dihydrolipoyl dehydrogenase (E3 component of pyruvate and 2-oxoglutarate dehydrogenases complexes) (Dihydrolipoamide dehydrogenase) [Magnetospirillum gryphiswaldense MSR-1 v2]|uniref:Dihydrolipoyl dehydrogenase n=1 Tax=Magnetospirillum gryphiswaldense (strain DSM 6361 / JCM 21280 / NBRC 15271 / MSR-1) TaxID=431944 RepID=V6F1K7_MAGGM|nr:dihydrolipoyl dehydrogenase [Magnetospirillum gryphiswaldense]CDK98186.1 Dihydrolipoyl dehydrogenase (E3 component of pyruvate and 2-oxoglutarate dehydrogenases complexes) (Dihydrolipoamide dehydrogenase) [Magnetospirillum gryphiswaldense MSR-1 v2]